MKKLYKKGKVHPITYDYLSLLPPTILALAVVLPPQDKQVLAYLLSCSASAASSAAAVCGGGNTSGVVVDHPTCFSCNCFRCYTSYWVKWDASPNRQVIHEIIDAFEQGSSSSLKKINKKQRRKRSKGSNHEFSYELNQLVEKSSSQDLEEVYVEEKLSSGCGEEVDGGGEVEETDDQKSSVRSVLNFLGAKIWSLLLI